MYTVAESFLEGEVRTALSDGKGTLRLAESVRCLCLAVVLFDNFGIDPAAIPREKLVVITDEINQQWLRSKCDPNVARSAVLDETIDSLGLGTPTWFQVPGQRGSDRITSTEVLGLLMPQYETLWRVVLLTFVTAYHHQPEARADAERRTADVPWCLGDPRRENEALQLAMAGFLPPTPFPS
ncbi:hypothetical protein VTK26DRAFT_9362 [Humicola hyalothermophila]